MAEERMFRVQVPFYLFSGVLLFSAIRVIFARVPVHAVLYLILAFFNAAGLLILLGAEFLGMLLIVVYVGAVAVLFLFVVMMLELPVPKKPLYTWRQQLENFSRAFLRLTGYGVKFLVFNALLAWLISPLWALIMTAHPELLEKILHIQMPAFFMFLKYMLIGISGGCNIVAAVMTYLFFRFGFKWRFFPLVQDFLKTLPQSWLLGFLLLAELSYGLSFWIKGEKLQGGTPLVPIPDPAHVSNTKALGKIIYTDYVFLFETAGFILLVAMVGAIVLTHRTRERVERQDIRRQVRRRKEETLRLHEMPLGEGV